MELRKNLRPLHQAEPEVIFYEGRNEPVLAKPQDMVIFEAPILEPLKQAVSHSEAKQVPPVLQPIVRGSTGSQNASPAIPPLEALKKSKKIVDLVPPAPVQQSIPQSAAEVKVAAESTPPVGGSQVEWPFGNERSQPEVVVEPTVEAKPEVPKLPDLQVIKKGVPEKKDIPQLEVFRTMEVVHLLLGRCAFDEDIVLLSSFAERDVRPKSPEELKAIITRKLNLHYGEMLNRKIYDYHERRNMRAIVSSVISPQHAAKGVEVAFTLRDTGQPSTEELSRYCHNNGVEVDEAREALTQSPYTAYSWALVKVKIGHDFGNFKITDLMPDL